MESEITTTTEIETPPPIAVTEPNGEGPKEIRPGKDDKEGKPRGLTFATKPIRDMQVKEDGDLAAWLEGLNAENADIRIELARVEPEQAVDPATGKMVKCNGHLKSYTRLIDEEFIQAKHGGGKYRLIVKKKDDKGRFQYFKAKDIEIGGDPRLDDVHRNMGPQIAQAAPPAAGEDKSLVNKAFSVLETQLEQARNATAPDRSGIDPGLQMVIDTMRAQLSQRDHEMAELRKEIAAARNVKPEVDPIKDKLLSSMIDGNSGQIEALRLRTESEIRMLKEVAREDEKRLRDQADRDRAEMRQSHEREIAMLKSSHDNALAALRHSLEMQSKMQEREIRVLERDNTEMRGEVKTLREKKDKSIIEQVKDMQAIKEALGLDEDDDKDKGTMDKIMDVIANPGTMEFAKGLIGKPAAPVAPPVQHKPQIVLKDGRPHSLEANGTLRPVRKKSEAGSAPPGEPQMPEIDPAVLSSTVNFLERAYEGQKDPEVVAQSIKPTIPEAILVAIRDHGVDVFMSKVAKLPSTSPLSNQDGRNWVRKLGKALVGE